MCLPGSQQPSVSPSIVRSQNFVGNAGHFLGKLRKILTQPLLVQRVQRSIRRIAGQEIVQPGNELFLPGTNAKAIILTVDDEFLFVFSGRNLVDVDQVGAGAADHVGLLRHKRLDRR